VAKKQHIRKKYQTLLAQKQEDLESYSFLQQHDACPSEKKTKKPSFFREHVENTYVQTILGTKQQRFLERFG
jgi:hypothetical protein